MQVLCIEPCSITFSPSVGAMDAVASPAHDYKQFGDKSHIRKDADQNQYWRQSNLSILVFSNCCELLQFLCSCGYEGSALIDLSQFSAWFKPPTFFNIRAIFI